MSSTNFSRPCSPEESSSTFSYCKSRSRRKLREGAERTRVFTPISAMFSWALVPSSWPVGASQQPRGSYHAFVAHSRMGSECRSTGATSPAGLPPPLNVSHLLSRDTFSNFLCAFLSSSWKHSCSCITGKVGAEPTAVRKWSPDAGHSSPYSLHTQVN